MKAIKCPNCGSEQVKELTEEKYACMACDNVFLIHNHSKEFRKTDEHISRPGMAYIELLQEILKLLTGMLYSYVMAIILMMMIKKWEVSHFSMEMVL